MVDAGIARRVDFGEGRFRFEHAYRHPRHFHLICKTCNQSFEFLSSDIEALVEEVADGARFPAAPERAADLRHAARTAAPASRPARRPMPDRGRLRARRAAHRHRDRAQRSRVLHARGAARARCARHAKCSSGWPARRRNTSASSRPATGDLVAAIPTLESQPTFLFFKGAANGLFAAGTEELEEGRRRSPGAARRHPLRARLAQVLQEVRRAVRGVGRQAHLPRVRRRGTRPPRPADSRVPEPGRAPGAGAPATAAAADRRDRSAPPHDRVRRPVGARGARPRGRGRRRPHARRHRPRHGRRPRPRRRRRAPRRSRRSCPASRSPPSTQGRDVHILGYFFDAAHPRAGGVSRAISVPIGAAGSTRCSNGCPRSACPWTRRAIVAGGGRRPGARAAAAGARARRGRPRAQTSQRCVRSVTWPTGARRSSNGAAPAPLKSSRSSPAPAASPSLAHPGKQRLEATVRALADDGLAAVEVFHPDHDEQDVARYRQIAKECDLLVTGGSDYHGPGSGRAVRAGPRRPAGRGFRSAASRTPGGRHGRDGRSPAVARDRRPRQAVPGPGAPAHRHAHDSARAIA